MKAPERRYKTSTCPRPTTLAWRRGASAALAALQSNHFAGKDLPTFRPPLSAFPVHVQREDGGRLAPHPCSYLVPDKASPHPRAIAADGARPMPPLPRTHLFPSPWILVPCTDDLTAQR